MNFDFEYGSVSAFIRGPVVHTLEGLLFAFGTVASCLAAIATWWWPSLIGLRPELSLGYTILFGLWPFVLLTVFVVFCSPHFRSSLYSSLGMFAAAAFPFYLAYG